MFVTSSQKYIMSGQQQQNTEIERQNLLDRLLDAVKQCQVRFGGKTELATDGDSRVICLLTQLEAVFQHGFKKSRVSAFRQVGQAAGIVKLDPDSAFWSFVKAHLGKLDLDRFLELQKATTDAGRGRAWLRSSLNEHSLERYFHNMLLDQTLLSQFYEKEAFLMDQERASMLPMIAAGLSSILFALTVDGEELNIVRQAPALTINKDVFSNILPSFPQKPVVEPLPVYSAELTDGSKTEKKKKKKKKKRNAAIVAIEDDDNLSLNSATDVKDLPLNDSTMKRETPASNSALKTSSLGHNRASSFPGNITLATEGSSEEKSHVNGQEIVFTAITKSISLPDNSIPVENVVEISPPGSKNSSLDLEEVLGKVTSEPEYVTDRESEQESTTGEGKGNFVLDFSRTQPRVEGKTNLQEVKNETERYGEKPMPTEIPTVFEDSGEPVLLPQENPKLSENDFFQSQNTFDSKRFNGGSSTVKAGYYSKEKDDLSQGPQSVGSFRVYGLTEDDGATDVNFSMAQFQVPNVVEIKNTEEEAVTNEPVVNGPQGSIDVNLIERGDTKNEPIVAHEHLDLRNSPGEKLLKQGRTNDQENLDNEEFRNDSNDYNEETTGAELQPGTFEPVVLLDSGESLVPLTERDRDIMKNGMFPNTSMENDRDSVSLSSWSNLEDGEEFPELKDDSPHNNHGRARAMTSPDVSAAAAALAACTDAQKGMDIMSRGLVSMENQAGNRDFSSRQDGMSKGELKQAIVSMMLRKDEMEENNRTLQNKLAEERQKSLQLHTETEDLKGEIKKQENLNAAKIQSLSRENELLKHQLKKYVGAVQALRSDLRNKSSETTEALSGIRQDDVLPPLPPERFTELSQRSEEAEEYKRKLIQVADLHGELLEFNERLHKQVSCYQYQVRRLREELVNLRGPLPEDLETPDDSSSLSEFDPTVISVGTRPLVNVWIPSVFLRGRSSNVHHVYQVYVRIKDDEWNVYRRYSQFFEMHKTLRRNFSVVDSFKFPPKKTIGNKDARFVEDRRRMLQDYVRRVVNLHVTTNQELRSDTTKSTLLQILPFFADPFPPEKTKKETTSRRKRSLNYNGL